MTDDTTALLARIAESTDLIAKLLLEMQQGERNQTEMILYLDAAGVAPGRIAALLGTTLQTVYPTLSRGRKKKSRKR